MSRKDETNECDVCGALVPSIIGCPNGKEVCPDCFESGQEDAVERRQIADCGCTHSPCPCEDAGCPNYGASCKLCPVHAAAPDLLAVLEEMTPDYEHCAPDESGYTETYRLRLIAKARAAIAAAKGEEK